ncbi:hypothetical protein I79_013527 [Cricetulus griseus]|uniref:Uncharacterized protein n=1 Tax=Cricetulus griseus TaxID=10029 RepID=G3HRM1_CRIGR|nr:hypothetical protein I79_013527 [Cricetulus griseus]
MGTAGTGTSLRHLKPFKVTQSKPAPLPKPYVANSNSTSNSVVSIVIPEVLRRR